MKTKPKIIEEQPPDIDYGKEDDLSPEAARKVHRLNIITHPHKYQVADDIYGRNSIVALLNDQSVQTSRWPKFPSGPAMYPTKDAYCQAVADYYNNLSDSMSRAYTKKCIEKGFMKSYDDIVNKSNLIDISRIHKDNECNHTDLPDITFTEHEMSILRSHGWYTFCPCFNDFTVKVNRKRYAHIKLITVNEKKKSIRFRLTMYIGDKYDWIAHIGADITMNFTDNGTDVSMNYETFDEMMYEELLTYVIDDMGWDKKKIQFWFDVYGINYLDKLTFINIKPQKTVSNYDKLSDEEKEGDGFAIPTYEHISFIQNNFCVQIETVCKGREAVDHFKDRLSKSLLISGVELLAAVNLQLFSEPRIMTEEKDYNREVYKFGKMTVKSKRYPIVPTESHIVRV